MHPLGKSRPPEGGPRFSGRRKHAQSQGCPSPSSAFARRRLPRILAAIGAIGFVYYAAGPTPVRPLPNLLRQSQTVTSMNAAQRGRQVEVWKIIRTEGTQEPQ